MNKKSLFLAIIALALIANAVHAENVYRKPYYSSPTDKIYLYNYPYWVGVNETIPVYVSNYDTTNTNYAEITLSGGNASNMTYIASTNTFRSYVTSSNEEDVNFTVNVYNSGGTLLATMNDTLRFRIPFSVEFHFYKNNNVTGTDVEAYKNEFQYATLFYNPNGKKYSYTLETTNSVSWLNKIGSIFPYYKDVGGNKAKVRVTDEIYLYARLDNGVATFKVYENGTYDMDTVNTVLYGGLSPMYEFGRPIANGDVEYNTATVKQINIDNESAASYSVFISAWQVYKWNLLMNIGEILFVLVLWGGGVVLLSFLITGWLPNDLRGEAFAVVMGTLAFVTSPVLVMAIRFVW